MRRRIYFVLSENNGCGQFFFMGMGIGHHLHLYNIICLKFAFYYCCMKHQLGMEFYSSCSRLQIILKFLTLITLSNLLIIDIYTSVQIHMFNLGF